MKRSGLKGPTLEQVQRYDEQRRESARRYEASRKRKAIPKVNKERQARTNAEQWGPVGFADWVRSLGCSVPNCGRRDVEVAHAKSRGAGGTWEETLPLCANHHRAQHSMGIRSFERHVGFSLLDVAAQVNFRWRAFTESSQ